MIVMKEGATQEQIDSVVKRVESVGAAPHVSEGEVLTVIGAIGDRERIANLDLEGAAGVDRVVPIMKPYKLASSQFKHGEPTVVEVDGRRVGGGNFSLMAGPCTVESREQLLTTAEAVKEGGASMLRGGAYKPRTSPYSFQGLGGEGLRLLAEAKEETGLPIVTELMDLRDLDAVLEVADVIQVGARNMQNYSLLAEIGRSGRAVLLKRGLAAHDRGAADGGGVRPQGGQRAGDALRARDSHVRDRDAVHARHHGDPGAEGASHLPVVVDPSHAAGQARPRAAAVAGGGRGGRGRDHRRGPPRSRGGDLRRAAGGAGGRRSPTTSSRSSGSRRSWARSCRRSETGSAP